MKKLLLISLAATMLFAQGKFGGVTYFDYTNSSDASAFNFNRQYFMYGVDVSDDVSFKVIFDVGRTNKGDVVYLNNDGGFENISEDTRLIAFLKKAQLDWKSPLGKMSFGMIGMNTYNVQEKNWGYRFIEKSVVDLHGFSATADLGIGISRSLMDNLNASMVIVNGEGFKKPQGDDKYHKIALNATFGEMNLSKNDGYNAGIVYSTEQTENDPTNMIGVFGGFAGGGLRIGGQVNQLTKNGESTQQVVSVNGNYSISEKLDGFVRYDVYDPNTDSAVIKDGKNYLLAGISMNCGTGFIVAPNIRMHTNENSSDPSKTEYKINFQFKF